MLQQERPDFGRRYWQGVLWSPFLFRRQLQRCPLNTLKSYIERQEKPC